MTDPHEFDVVVSRTRTVAEDVVLFDLRSVDGLDMPQWEPGAHIDVWMPGGMVRQYSLCGDPSDRSRLQIAVLRQRPGRGRGGSEYMHASIAPGSIVRIGRPRNNFPLTTAARYLFVAGGIGITPLLPMIRQVASTDASWHLTYGGRNRESMAFGELLTSYGEHVSIHPEDPLGLIDLDSLLDGVPPETLLYACGPEPLLRAIDSHRSAHRFGSIRMERFSPDGSTPVDRNTAFDVVLARSNTRYTVPPDRSILQTLESHGVELLSSCQQGMCGRCELTVLEGEPDHRDSILTPEERDSNEYILICVSRSMGKQLVLDI